MEERRDEGSGNAGSRLPSAPDRYRCDGDLNQAEATLNREFEMFETTGLKFELPSVQTALGICAARRGDWEAFENLIQKAHDGISESGATSLLVAAGADAAADLAPYQSEGETMARKLAHSQWIALGHPRAPSL